MKRALILVLLFITTGVSKAQSHSAGPRQDLGKLSSAQLTACYDNLSICGAPEVYAISDELTKRLPAFSASQLVDCMKNWKACGVENDIETGWAVSAELARRGHLRPWLEHYWRESDPEVRDGIVHAAYRVKTPEVTAFMKKVLAQRKGDDDALFWPANYLAKQCDTDALQWLSTREGRPEGCLLWAPTVALFGKCNYRPAIPYIVENSIWDACLNIDDAGADALLRLFPHSPKRFKSTEELQAYFCSRARKEGFNVNCPTQ